MIMFTVGSEIGDKCTILFLNYWNKVYFLMGSELYVYKEDDLTQGDLYMKRSLVGLFKR